MFNGRYSSYIAVVVITKSIENIDKLMFLLPSKIELNFPFNLHFHGAGTILIQNILFLHETNFLPRLLCF